MQCASEALDYKGRSVVVLPGDVPMMTPRMIRGLIDQHDGAITIGSMIPDEPFGYGRIVRGDDGSVLRIVEQKDASEAEQSIPEVNTAIYVFDGDFLFGSSEGERGAVFELDTDNKQKEYLLTDVVGIATQRGLRVGAAVIPDPAEVAGVNDRAQLADLERETRVRIARDWLRAGVSMDDPATCLLYTSPSPRDRG